MLWNPESTWKSNHLFFGLWLNCFYFICKKVGNETMSLVEEKNILCLNVPKDRTAKKKRSSEPNNNKKNPYSICDSVFCKEAAYIVWSSVSFMSLTPAWTFLKQHDALLSSLIGSTSHHLHPLSSSFFFLLSIERGSRPCQPNRSDMCFWFENLQ